MSEPTPLPAALEGDPPYNGHTIAYDPLPIEHDPICPVPHVGGLPRGMACPYEAVIAATRADERAAAVRVATQPSLSLSELEALPFDSAVIDKNEVVWQWLEDTDERGAIWGSTDGDWKYEAKTIHSLCGPVVLLHVGGQG